ncbi:peptidase inhibitor family I36 [Krasilnikovia cinnamomea]|uniref:Peptidase inhibitor family I36 n=1 Tax=Krasilnikovia cinnamomea TaxID=349313 RepID=A0A4Q7ZIA8_9ACTN|nr:peptidase inhibitor family I36 protein [Krasilnikovia cinnamomea]RZU50171.1 peptidase inhibitor family I36 [Krasilnikovia cinnamomea]
MINVILIGVLLGQSLWFATMTNIKRGIAAVAAGAVAGVLTFGSAAYARPVPVTDSPCTDEHICFYAGENFARPAQSENAVDDNGYPCHNMSSALNNKTTSIANFTHFQFYVYDNGGCTGSPLATIYAMSANTNIGRANNDRITSFRISRR